MTKDPAIVHKVADLRREALLAEASVDRLTTPTHLITKRSGPGKACRRVVTWFAMIASRIVDEFEPIPTATSLETGRLEPRMRS